MNQKVKIQANETGGVINTSANNPDYGYIRLTQTRFQFDETGFMRSVNLSSLLKGKVEDLKAAGFTPNQELPGRIVIKESLQPSDPNNGTRDLKLAGKSGVTCLYNDQPIYRTTFYSTNADAEDTLIAHTNAEEIKQSLKAAKVTGVSELSAEAALA